MSIIFYILEYKNQTSPAELYFENQLIRDKISNARIRALLSICFVYLLFIFLFFIINRSSLLPYFLCELQPYGKRRGHLCITGSLMQWQTGCYTAPHKIPFSREALYDCPAR